MSKDKELTTAEIRKLIRAHNVLMSIKIPPQTSREGILKILDDKGYMVNHIRKSIQRRYKNERKPNVTLKQADTILKKPDKTQAQIKTEADKKKVKQEKQRVEKAKELKLAKKEGVKEFKEGLKKAPVKKAPVKKEPTKALKKEVKKVEPKKVAPPLQLGDKPASVKEWAINKAQRNRLNQTFKEKWNNQSIYQVLGFDNNADPSPAEVKKACRRLKLKNHPDKGGEQAKFQSIQEACDIFIETFKEKGQGTEAPSEATNTSLFAKVKAFISKYSASEIKKFTGDQSEIQAFSDKAVDMYNEIQGILTREYKFTKTIEQKDLFNELKLNYKLYNDTQKLLVRRINARVKVLRRTQNFF